MMVKKQQVHPLEALKRSKDCWKVSTGDDELEGEEWGSVDCLQGQVQQGPRGAFAATHEVQFS